MIAFRSPSESKHLSRNPAASSRFLWLIWTLLVWLSNEQAHLTSSAEKSYPQNKDGIDIEKTGRAAGP
jgi:hypothetical protein